ncbi:MAG TPA: glycoside hydrolase family 15 protein [Pyrinomonadaceae bacterium]
MTLTKCAIIRFIIVLLCGWLYCHAAIAQSSNSDSDAHWLSAAKNGFGTSTSLRSKVWFTLTHGVLSEVYYPTLDVPNVQCLQLIVVTPDGNIETELEDTTHTLLPPDGRSLSYTQINSAKSGAYIITKSYVTDSDRNTLLIQITFKALKQSADRYKLYVYYDPSLANSGMHDSAWSEAGTLIATEKDKTTALISNPAFVETANGLLNRNDGLTELRAGHSLKTKRVDDGNVVQVGRLPLSPNNHSFTLALGLGNSSNEAEISAAGSLAKGFAEARREYERGWISYTAGLPRTSAKHQRQLNVAAMVLKASEDKTYRGAFISSPSIPWGGGPNANEPNTSGYHAVWARDLYQVATAFLALGDRTTANRALDYVFNVQQRADGSVPQNSWVNGRPIGGGSQLDEVALPIVLAYQLRRYERATWLKHIKPAADYIVQHGPATNQDRWEEKSGFSPATIAAEIAGLINASKIARLNNDSLSSARYLATANDWANRLAIWTATSNGPHADGSYFLRLTEKGDPNQPSIMEINSGGGSYDQREIVDAGFLELVRLGITSANDPLITKSLAVVDEVIKVETPSGSGWRRYNHDAYGETSTGGPYDARNGIGRLWTLLTGERGEYELSAGNVATARQQLYTLANFANDGLLIPEQVWDRGPLIGTGTASATPLAWSMAQFIRLALRIDQHCRSHRC